MKESAVMVKILKNIAAITLFFALFYAVVLIFSFLENGVRCFPVTIITTDKEATDDILDSIELCSMSVEIEKMTFDSAVFNHYEKLPVKEIYLYSVEMPFSEWDSIKNMNDAITETNPYIYDIVNEFNNSKIRYQSIAFIFVFLLGLVFLLKTAPSWKSTKKEFKVSFFFLSATFFLLSGALLAFSKVELYPFILITLSILLSAYLIIFLIIYQLMKKPEKK